MSIEIFELSDHGNESWDELVKLSSTSTVHHTIKYRNFLTNFLISSESKYLCIYSDKKMVAVLPMFLKDGPFGQIANSLPFFGSHGSLIWNPLHNVSTEVKQEVYCSVLQSILKNQSLSSMTFIDPLFDTQQCFQADGYTHLNTSRIGQYSRYQRKLDKEKGNFDILDSLSPKKKWDIKKAQEFDFKISRETSESILFELFNLHKNNMEFIGGKFKTFDVFQSISTAFKPEDDYLVYIAKLDGEAVAGLCLLFHNKQVEYFIPAVEPKFRSTQVLSLLIYTALQESLLDRDITIWNWGGTWNTQKGVHKFKQSWGAIEKTYNYHTWVLNTLNHSNLVQSEIIKHYNYFYYLPFEESNRKNI